MLTSGSNIDRPSDSSDRGAWQEYWRHSGQPWRIEPEISAERQAFLRELRNVNTEAGQSPFANIALSRADVEWLFDTDRATRPSSIRAVSVSADGSLLLAASGSDLGMWDLRTGEVTAHYFGHSGRISSCVFSADGHLALSASVDSTLRLWDTISGQALRVLIGHAASINACSLSADGRLALSASDDATLRLWDITSGQVLRVFEGHDGAVTACALSPDGRIALSGSADSSLRLWNSATGTAIGSLAGHTGGITSCQLSGDGRFALSASYDRTLRLWDLEAPQEALVLVGHQQAVTACSFSPTGNTIASGDSTGVMLTWDAPSGRLLARQIGQNGQINAIALSPDGRVILGCDNGSLQVIDEATGAIRTTLSGSSPSTRGLVCALYPPRIIPRANRRLLPVYLSPNEARPLSRVEANAQALLRDTTERRQRHRPRRFSVTTQIREPTNSDAQRHQRAAYITVIPSIPGLRCSPTRRTIRWRGDLDRLDFMVQVEKGEPEQTVSGVVQIFVGPFLFAEVPLVVEIGDDNRYADEQTAVKVVGHSFRKVFVSYAHRDANIVMLLKNTLETMGDEVLIDAEILRGGGYWQVRLWQAIQQANRFQLFWSRRSAKSKYVADEWQFALSQGKDMNEFIRACFWSRKPYAIPPELSAFQFEQVQVFRFLPWWRRWVIQRSRTQ